MLWGQGFVMFLLRKKIHLITNSSIFLVGITYHSANSAASQESSCSPSSVRASFYSSSSYNIDCSSWLFFSTFNLNHFSPLTFTKSRTSISAETPPLLALWSNLLSFDPLPAAHRCSLWPRLQCLLCHPGRGGWMLSADQHSCEHISFERNHELNYILSVILTGTHSSRGCRTSTPIITFSPISKPLQGSQQLRFSESRFWMQHGSSDNSFHRLRNRKNIIAA